MTQADRVHSTPPINTSARHSRRSILTTIAAGSIAGLTPAIAAGEEINLGANKINVLAPKTPSKEITPSRAIEGDPAFALIAEKLAADVAHCEAIDAEDEFDEQCDHSSDAAIEAQENSETACHYVHEVDWKLATTPPTTLGGVAAVLRFANEIEDAGNEWPDTDAIGREGWHYQLRATMAAAIEALLIQAGKAVRS
jgi:hypothetical protein